MHSHGNTAQNVKPGPRLLNFFSCSTQMSMKFQQLIKTKILKNKDFSCFQTLKWCIYHGVLNNCWLFNIYEQDKFHAELSLKKAFRALLGVFRRQPFENVCLTLRWLFKSLLLTISAFANNMDPDQNVGPDLDPNGLIPWWYSKRFYEKVTRGVQYVMKTHS